MHTKILLADEHSVKKAATLLMQGEVVGIPTETVYGLAANALNSEAVQRIFAAKGRPQDNPLIVHIDSAEMLALVAKDIPADALKLAKAFWPGPLTIVLKRTDNIAIETSAGLDTVGVRMPSHPVAQAIISASGLPLAAPSANRSGRPSPTTAKHVFEDMQGRIPLIIDGGPAAVGLESTIISLVGSPLLLRPGFITKAQLGAVLGKEIAVDSAVEQPLKIGESPLSPGMKYTHYAPKAKLIILLGSFEKFCDYTQNLANKTDVWALCFEGEDKIIPLPCVVYGTEQDSVAQAKSLFAALRRLDANTAKTVYVRLANTDGVGLAVYNRLLRAAAFRVVTI